jgi:hypothetical protein
MPFQFLNDEGNEDIGVDCLGGTVELGSCELPRCEYHKMVWEGLNNGRSIVFLFDVDAHC